MLNCVGIVEEMPESHMDAVTGLSGNGPAYVRVHCVWVCRDCSVLLWYTCPSLNEVQQRVGLVDFCAKMLIKIVGIVTGARLQTYLQLVCTCMYINQIHVH